MITRPGDDVPAWIEPVKAGGSSEDPERVGEHDVVVVVPLLPRLHSLGRDNVRLLAGWRPPGRHVRPRERPDELKRLGLNSIGHPNCTADAGVFGLSRRRRQAKEKLVDVLDVHDACFPALDSLGQPAAATPPRPNGGGQVRAECKSYPSSDKDRSWPVSAPTPDDPAQAGGDDCEADLRQRVQIHSSQIRPIDRPRLCEPAGRSVGRAGLEPATDGL